MRRSDHYLHTESHGSAVLLWLGGSSLVLALALLAMLYAPTMQALGQWAQVGMYAHVPENEYNSLARELSEKERELAIREAMVAGREAEVRNRFIDTRSEHELVYMTAFGLLLFGMIMLNFVLDIRRSRQPRLRTIVKI